MQQFGVQSMDEEEQNAQKELEKQDAKLTAKVKRYAVKKIKDQTDMEATVWWMCAVGILHAFTLSVAIFGGSWNWAQFTGVGASMVRIRTSMFMIEVDMECGGKNPLEDAACKAMESVQGTHLISKMRAQFSSVSNRPADLMNWIFYSNLLIFFFFVFAIASHMIASSLLYYYWKEAPLPKVRQWAQAFYVMAPISAVIGLVLWTVSSPDLKELPESFTSTAQLFTGGHNIIGLEAIPAMIPFGWCWFWSVWCVFVQLCTLSVWPCFFHRHVGEEAALAEEENLKELAMQEGLLAYGAELEAETGVGSYGGAQYQQAQAPYQPNYQGLSSAEQAQYQYQQAQAQAQYQHQQAQAQAQYQYQQNPKADQYQQAQGQSQYQYQQAQAPQPEYGYGQGSAYQSASQTSSYQFR